MRRAVPPRTPIDFKLIALTPPGISDPSIAIAASRAGGIGLLNLELCPPSSTDLDAISMVDRHARNLCGLKLGAWVANDTLEWIDELPEIFRYFVLSPSDKSHLKKLAGRLRKRDALIFLEAIRIEDVELAEELAFDGVIAKGNESGGRCGEETTFILLQRILARTSLPVWAQGGIGLHTAAACFVAGATGAVLDAQLTLTKESALPDEVRATIDRMDGSETLCLGNRIGDGFRMFSGRGTERVEELRQIEERLLVKAPGDEQSEEYWRNAIRERIGWKGDRSREIWPLGQDAAFASEFANRFVTVGGVFRGIRQEISDRIRSASHLKPLDKESPLARSHQTTYPIVQGPMTRVSDRAAFAREVARAGGLPFLALALMRAEEVRTLLQQTKESVGDRSWGVGILGFVPAELRKEQYEAILEARPPFALIAGGRPDQAMALEESGINTYLHVPSPQLLELFIEQGVRRFVFEGRECGGHVGPRASFVLWNLMVQVLIEKMPEHDWPACHVLFAGGIHDAKSSAMVATIGASLAEKGAKIGVLMGTPYLFTEEAVSSEAITDGFQDEALRCDSTQLLESGPGHVTRCANTPFADTFSREHMRMVAEGRTSEEIKEALEKLNLGRLRIATKGITRNPSYNENPRAPKFLTLTDVEQRDQGMYMIGQSAALRDRVCSIEALHGEVSENGSDFLDAFSTAATDPSKEQSQAPFDIAIVGMSCILPGAPDLETFWENILDGVDSITEVPAERWDWRAYFDADPDARDKIYSRWGGFIDDVPFDPLQYGIPPSSLPSIEPVQLLTLEAVRAALDNAGYTNRDYPKERTSVILGAGGGVAALGNRYAVRSALPQFAGSIPAGVFDALPEWTEDSFPGILLNVAAGRVANRFDFGGVNYVVDAACASSLAAVYMGARELEAGTSDMVIVGGIEAVQEPFGYLAFSKTHALSKTGKCRTFDEKADGISISEGLAFLVLKRLEEAERDGDRIYAVIKGAAGSSDGRDKGLTAPRPEGQALALHRAYEKAGFSPNTVELIEAHGTGTVVGDRTEVETLRRVFEAVGSARRQCAIGSVKSMIGHTKCAAGTAGLIKVALALHHKVLPPTLNVDRPNPEADFPGSPFYVNTERRPWIHGAEESPRRAGVSAFGFGGTNFHTVLEEYTGSFLPAELASPRRSWPTEVFVWRADSREALQIALTRFAEDIHDGLADVLGDLAKSVWQQARSSEGLTLSIVSSSVKDLEEKLRAVSKYLEDSAVQTIQDPRGIYFDSNPIGRESKVAFLFPGQGSQYVGMGSDLAEQFDEVRAAFDQADRILSGHFEKPLSAFIFPPPAFEEEEERDNQHALSQTPIAQPALGATEIGLMCLMDSFGLQPDTAAGHSYGEYVALCAAGVLSETDLFLLSEERGRSIVECADEELGGMIAVQADEKTVTGLIGGHEEVWLANMNAPSQTILSGTEAGISTISDVIREAGFQVKSLPVACGFHSPLVAKAKDRLARYLKELDFKAPSIPVYSNATAAPYEPDSVASTLAEHLVQPVRFEEQIRNMYRDGARIFIEVGPGSVLKALTGQILDGERHVAVSLDTQGRAGIVQLHHALAVLIAQGISLDLDRLFARRRLQTLDLKKLDLISLKPEYSPTTWLVNGGRARPIKDVQRDFEDVRKITGAPASNGALTRQSTVKHDTSLPELPARPISAFEEPAAAILGRDNVESDRLLERFQHTMNAFLETQREVMKAYLAGRGALPGSGPLPVEAPAVGNSGYQPDPREEIVVQNGASPPSEAIERQAEPAGQTIAVPTLGNHDDVAAKLLDIVSDRTGYPVDVLGLDMNLESDLSIDSIKRVEILGSFQQMYFSADSAAWREELDRLTQVKTLREIIDLIAGISDGEPAVPTNGRVREPVHLPRYTMESIEEPLPERRSFRPRTGITLVTNDGKGIAPALVAALQEKGQEAVLVNLGRFSPNGAESITLDVNQLQELENSLARLREEHGALAGIIHLYPLQESGAGMDVDMQSWKRQIDAYLKTLFLLAKAVYPHWAENSFEGRPFLFAASGLGGDFGYSEGPVSSPVQGGMTGFLKTCAIEWPAVDIRMIDLDPESSPEAVTSHFIEELSVEKHDIEIGFREGRRRVLRTHAKNLNGRSEGDLIIDRESVILLTGGARGITAEIANELAERFKPVLILAGSTPPPDGEEPPWSTGVTDPKTLKRNLIATLQGDDVAFSLQEIERRVMRLLKEREIRSNLDRIRSAGAQVEYIAVDVRDESAFGDAIDRLYRQYGRLDGVIHGAGIIEDKLVKDKTLDSFERVVSTKLLSAYVLSKKLKPELLSFLVFFASVAGRFGNRGQSDYAAANECLNKLALQLNARWPARVVSLNWGPWDKKGMASLEVKQHFEALGVALIDPEPGRKALIDELVYGCSDEVEIVLGEGPWSRSEGVPALLSKLRSY